MFIHFIHPFIQSVIARINIIILYCLVAVITIWLVYDTITSIVKVKGIKGKLEYIETLNKEIKEKLKEITQQSREKEISNANMQALVDKLKKKRSKASLRLYRHVYRLKRAFPAINTKEIAEVLSKKMEIKKKTKNT